MAGSVPSVPRRDIAISPPQRASAQYLRDTRSGVIASRPAALRDHRDDVRLAWRRASALAMEIMQNSGRIRGAADQVVADTIGTELRLDYQPDLSKAGYDDQETRDFVKMVKTRFKRWAWDAAECDFRGKRTLAEMLDCAVRWDMAYGEATAVIDYMPPATRRRYGIETGTKLLMVPPTRLTQETEEFNRLYQGIRHDENARAIGYRFSEKIAGYGQIREYAALDRAGRKLVIHAFDALSADDVRGISRMASAFRQHIQQETLVDTTLQTMILQTVFAATLTSGSASAEAFEAVMQIGETDKEMGDFLNAEMMGYMSAQYRRASEGGVTIGTDPRISHLAPGEKLEIQAVQTPNSQFLPLNQALSRDMARAIGITVGGLTMDYSEATYSSVRMENSSIWPVVVRRRERIPAPIAQGAFESWMDEEIGEGRLPFKGGYANYLANRSAVLWANWRGPARPTADDLKSAKATTEELLNGTTSIGAKCAENGTDFDEIFDEQQREHQRYVEAGMASPYDRRSKGVMQDNSVEEDGKRSGQAA